MGSRVTTVSSIAARVLDEASAWALLRALAERASAGVPLAEAAGIRLDEAGRLECVASPLAWVAVDPEREDGLAPGQALSPLVAELLALYLPLCAGARSSVA